MHLAEVVALRSTRASMQCAVKVMNHAISDDPGSHPCHSDDSEGS